MAVWLFQPMLFWLCEGIIPGVCSALSATNLKDHFLLVLELGCGDEDLCTRAQDLRHCLASAALTSCSRRRTVAFYFAKGPGEMSCQRLHLRLVMELGVPHRALELEFSAQTYIWDKHWCL